jgi:hypothetical protein
MVEQQIERVRTHVGGAQHERHLPVHLPHHHHGFARGPQLRDLREQVDGDVGIAAKADLHGASGLPPRHDVRHDIHAMRQQVARHVGVVGAQIVRLGMARGEQRAWFEEKLDDTHIGRHLSAAYRRQIIQFGVIAEDAFGQWLHEAPLEIAAPRGFTQAERREDGEIEVRVGARAAEEFVGDEVRFADAERQGQDYLVSDAP